MIRKDFPKKSQFADILDTIITAGLPSKWEKDLKRQPNKTEQKVFEERPVSMSDLGAVVSYLAFLMFMSVVALFGEINIYHQSRAERPFGMPYLTKSVWHAWEKWICGKRYYFLLDQPNFVTNTVFKCIDWIRNEVSSWIATIIPIVEKFHRAVIVPGIYLSVVLFAFLNVLAIIVWIAMKYYV